jgi:cytochrome c oxidase subunit III
VGAAILFFTGLAVIAAWWLSKHRLGTKPWLEPGAAGEFPGAGVSAVPTAKIGLGVFLAVVGSLFALLLSAYFMRMQLADWRPVPKPTILWINTGVLVLSSAALLWAQDAAARRDAAGVRTGLLVAGVAALAFLVGQLIAWQQLADAGYFLASNPANAFFYLITAVHGLHLLGGLVAFGGTALKARGDIDLDQLRLTLELCAMYWHFLLLLWLVLFSLLFLT